jgi:hypothetical protein
LFAICNHACTVLWLYIGQGQALANIEVSLYNMDSARWWYGHQQLTAAGNLCSLYQHLQL